MRSPAAAAARRLSLLGAFLLVTLPACDRLGVLGRLGAPFFERPSLRFAGAEISNLSLQGLTIAFRIRVHNPNPFRITLRDWRYTLSLNEVDIPARPVREPEEIGPRGDRVITIPVDVTFASLMEVAARGMSRLSLAYDFRSSLEVGTWLGSKAVPFEAAGEVSLPARPGDRPRQDPTDGDDPFFEEDRT